MRKSMWFSLLASCVIVSCSCSMVSNFAGYTNDLAWVEYNASVRVMVTCKDGRSSGGTGVAIDAWHVVTAKHVVTCGFGSEPETVKVTIRGRGAVEGTVDAYPDNDDVDAARIIIKSNQNISVTALPSARQVDVGEELCYVGGDFPNTYGMKKCGWVSDRDDNQIVVALHGVPGNSGGPVYDSDGRVVGILVRGRWAAEGEFVVQLEPVSRWKDLL